MGSIPIGLLAFLTVLFVITAAVLVAAESSVARLSRAAVDDLLEDGHRNAKRLLALVEERRRSVLAARAGRIAMQTGAAVAITIAFAQTGWRWWAVLLASLAINWLIAFAVISVFPQQVAWRNPERTALHTVGLLELTASIGRLGAPALRSLRKFFPAPEQTEAQARAEMTEEMREVVDQVGETEGFEDEDREMLRSVFELGHTFVREVMVPRTDMVTIQAETTLEKAIRLFIRSGYSRIPVIGESSDDIVGILYFKDLVTRVVDRPENREKPVRDVCREAHFVPEMLYADDELRHMQQLRVHMVMVVDEWGGIAGLLTIEDLIEEIVGEVMDEHDRRVVEPEEVEPGVWRVPARFPVIELGELMGLDIEDDDVDSVGGLLQKALGKVPLPGAKAEALGLELEAEEAIGRRRQVGTILATRLENEPEEES
ncbi:hemolysin family protein [Actinomyces sp. S4-C9]|uniref:hemolysin family protein n=1 Tax=Actinomyces sp. S4-C9 TaxID=1219581 RepID=UPI00050E70DC|nr:hemolysin family protein [Actinomyces sp. S4-C9]KGF01928.1 membrane protein [Actinomyces sp. S4-C9]